MVGKAADWLREERRNVLGHWSAFCLELRRCAALVRGVRGRAVPDVPDLRRRDAAPLPGLHGALLVDVRGRLRGVRREAPRARAARDADPPAGDGNLFDL